MIKKLWIYIFTHIYIDIYLINTNSYPQLIISCSVYELKLFQDLKNGWIQDTQVVTIDFPFTGKIQIKFRLKR